jgi:nicotinate-nucleotide pyrophosphorylase (carboxylating)
MNGFSIPPIVDRLIDLALEEDLGTGDITTDFLMLAHETAQGAIVAKENLILCGLSVAERVFRRVDGDIVFLRHFHDGDAMASGRTVLTVTGRAASLLRAERIALNFLQRLSGIATHVRAHVQTLAGAAVRLTDTRKTTPGWRVLEKYAVRVGGAANHRMGLYDGVLIKDNHIAACGGIAAAVARARDKVSHLIKIEVETSTLEEVQEALDAGADVIMLDNMNLEQIKNAVKLIAKRVPVEISGGVTKERLPELAATGVDLISMGALTHSARAVDLSMRITRTTSPT